MQMVCTFQNVIILLIFVLNLQEDVQKAREDVNNVIELVMGSNPVQKSFHSYEYSIDKIDFCHQSHRVYPDFL